MIDKDDIKDQMRGRWDEYFSSRLGFEAHEAKNVPCFICEATRGDGGEDRFYWTNFRGDGGYYCRGAGDAHSHDGIGLARELWAYTQGYQLTFGETLADIAHWLEGQPARTTEYKRCEHIRPEAQDKTDAVLRKQDCSNSRVFMHPYVQGKELVGASVFRSKDTGVFQAKGSEEVINVPYSAYDDPFGPRIGVEQIYPDGRKLTLAGTHKGVNLLCFNRDCRDPKWLVVEGWATGLALCQVLRNSNAGPYRVAVSGGKGKLDHACASLPNARPVYEDDGDGVPDGALHFIKTPNGNDIADHLKAGDHESIQHFINQLQGADDG